MDLAHAITLLAADVRESYPEVSNAEAVAHVRNTMAVESSGPGWDALNDDGTELAAAYRAVLLADALELGKVLGHNPR